jgi:hypothetical protein
MSLKQALISGQGFSYQEAEEIIAEMKQRVLGGEDPEEVLFEEGLEPDYLFDLI